MSAGFWPQAAKKITYSERFAYILRLSVTSKHDTMFIFKKNKFYIWDRNVIDVYIYMNIELSRTFPPKWNQQLPCFTVVVAIAEKETNKYWSHIKVNIIQNRFYKNINQNVLSQRRDKYTYVWTLLRSTIELVKIIIIIYIPINNIFLYGVKHEIWYQALIFQTLLLVD